MSAHILAVEDESAIQELLTFHLTQAGYLVQCVSSAEDAWEVMRVTVPDLVLLDWMLPGASGMEIARRMKANDWSKGIPIIMLTARAEEMDKVRLLEVGADDYVTKPFSPRELSARIKAVLRRRAPQTTDDPIVLGGLRLDPQTHRVTGAHGELDMGPTEFRLLHYFMSYPERVHSRVKVLDHVWGDGVFVEDRTVDAHIRRLRLALGEEYAALIQTVRGIGYRFSVQKNH